LRPSRRAYSNVAFAIRAEAPLVMIYEQQFLEYILSRPKPNPDMVLLYPLPTILSKHTLVALSDNGARFAQEMISNPKVSSIAQRSVATRT